MIHSNLPPILLIVGVLSFSATVTIVYRSIFNLSPNNPVGHIFWGIIWSTITVIAFFPRLAVTVTEQLGFGKNLNTLIFIGFIIIFFLIYRLLVIIGTLQKKINKLISAIAISNYQSLKDESVKK